MARVQRSTSIIFRHGTTIRVIAAAFLLVVGVASWLGSEPATATKPVAVAARDIPSGASLTAADVTVGQDSLGLDSAEPEVLIGETVRGPIAEGEPITLNCHSAGTPTPMVSTENQCTDSDYFKFSISVDICCINYS